MSNLPPPFKAPGPFDRIIGIQFSNNIRFGFRFTRDDGTIYTPELEENLTIAIYSPTLTLLCFCESKTL
jgi:hypothetical protein